VTLKSTGRVEVIRHATICTSLNSTDQSYVLPLKVQTHRALVKLYRVRYTWLRSFRVIQRHRNWYQLKARMQLPIRHSLPL